MADGVEQIKKEFYKAFPGLEQDNLFAVTSPATDEYNCIAWAMGFDDRWVDCSTDIEGHWWPPIPSCDCTPESLVKAFEYMKFEKCEDGKSEEGYEKVALYMKDDVIRDPITDNIDMGYWTHASRVLNDNECHSKMGQSFDIHHRNGDVFDNSCYGHIYTYMKRKLSDKSIVDVIINEEESDFEIAW